MGWTIGGSFGQSDVPGIGIYTPTAIGGGTIGATTNSGTQQQPYGQPTWLSIAGLGTDIFKTVMAYNAANNQIDHGQYPTTIGQSGNIAGTADVAVSQQLGKSGLSQWISPGIIGGVILLVVVILVLKK